MKKIAVVILNWNGCKLLKQFLPSVIRNSTQEDVEIIVADNCSTDDSLAFLQENYPQVRTIVLSQNYGYAEGYNQALAQVEAEYFVLLNSDVEVTDNWLYPVISFMDTNRDVAAAQPKIRAQRNKTFFEYAGASGGFIDKYGYPFCRGRIFDTVEKDNAQYNDVIDIFWASGACMFIRSKDYFEVGGLDASFFVHMEEIDLCWRLNARGRRLVCVPSSEVYHVGGATLAEDSPRKVFLNFRNNLLMLYKNMDDTEFLSVMRYRKLLDYIAAFKFLISGKLENAKAVLKAHKDFKLIRDSYNETREENVLKSAGYIMPTVYRRSILYQFYIKKHKHYSELEK